MQFFEPKFFAWPHQFFSASPKHSSLFLLSRAFRKDPKGLVMIKITFFVSLFFFLSVWDDGCELHFLWTSFHNIWRSNLYVICLKLTQCCVSIITIKWIQKSELLSHTGLVVLLLVRFLQSSSQVSGKMYHRSLRILV